MTHRCPTCNTRFNCLVVYTIDELAEFFKVLPLTIRSYMDRGKPPLKYRLRMVRRRPGYERIVDGSQLEEFLEAIWPTPAELDPSFSDRHREIVRRMKKIGDSMRLAREGQKRNLDPTLSPSPDPTLNHLPSESDRDKGENLRPRINKDERSPTGPYQSEGENKETERVEGERERETEQGKE